MNFSKYPKIRPPLPAKLQELHEKIMLENREGKSLGSKLSNFFERWLHLKVVRNSPRNLSTLDTLEIGAGRLNHLEYEGPSRYYDIVEPRDFLYKNSPLVKKIRTAYSDISDIPATNRYDRIISIAVLEHVLNLPSVVASAGLLLKPDGVFCVSIPSEGELPWHLACSISTGLEYRLRTGYSYNVFLRHEHVNTAREIGETLRYFFSDVECSVLGLSPSLSIYQFFRCSLPKIEVCQSCQQQQSKVPSQRQD